MALIEANPENKNYKIGVVTSRFNRPVTEKLEEGAIGRLHEAGLTEDDIIQVRVPGAVEIPLVVKQLFDAGCDAVVTVGAVIRGETTHYDFVCNSVERGCSQLMLEYGRPVGFGVITTENAEQAYARAGGKKGNKGADCSEVVLEMLGIKEKLSQLS
jgi:6,7-dimethyl-8-ribityllumazine synthase